MRTKEEKTRILYLDDEENNLTSFKATFRRDYKIFTTTSPNEAVKILGENDIHIVISDQKMPNLSGVEFFELINPDFPEPIRMLLTGYADIEAVIDAINKGQVYKYISKPWNVQELKITIDNAFELFNSRRELKLKTIELEKAYDELEKFVYSASHDLRAPLGSVLGILKLAKAEGLEGVAAEYFKMIEKTVGKLDSFVQNLINYYQNLKKGVSLIDVDLDLLVDEVFGTFSHFDGAEDVQLKKNITVDKIYRLDQLRLKMILNNLVSNSIKYRDRTREQSFFELSISEEENNLQIIAQDNGVGIDQESLPKIYEMFYRVAEDDLGSGIGLYIVKEAVEKLGGTIDVDSQQGNGCRFTITLPIN